MKSEPTLEFFLYAAVIALSLAALALVIASATQFADIKPVYQGF